MKDKVSSTLSFSLTCNIFSEFRKLLQLIHVLPVTTASAVRSFSSLRRLKTHCCDRKSLAAGAQNFAQRHQAAIEIMRRNLSYYCLLAPRIYIFVLHAHPARGESHNQRNATGEVATVPPNDHECAKTESPKDFVCS